MKYLITGANTKTNVNTNSKVKSNKSLILFDKNEIKNEISENFCDIKQISNENIVHTTFVTPLPTTTTNSTSNISKPNFVENKFNTNILKISCLTIKDNEETTKKSLEHIDKIKENFEIADKIIQNDIKKQEDSFKSLLRIRLKVKI
jgi:hypothetical protein